MEDLKERTKRFSLEIIKFIDEIPVTTASKVVINQLLDQEHLLEQIQDQPIVEDQKKNS